MAEEKLVRRCAERFPSIQLAVSGCTLIAGSSAFDESQDALSAILAEWTSNNSYSTRINNLRNGGGANGPFVLDGTTVVDDFAADTLWGQGGQDWFLIGSRDKLKDRASGELLN